jgi:hypothetical protein
VTVEADRVGAAYQIPLGAPGDRIRWQATLGSGVAADFQGAWVTRVVEPRFLADGGAMGAMIRRHDWSASPLGIPATWPEALRTLVEVMLGANQPMFVVWGANRTLRWVGINTDIEEQKVASEALARPVAPTTTHRAKGLTGDPWREQISCHGGFTQARRQRRCSASRSCANPRALSDPRSALV